MALNNTLRIGSSSFDGISTHRAVFRVMHFLCLSSKTVLPNSPGVGILKWFLDCIVHDHVTACKPRTALACYVNNFFLPSPPPPSLHRAADTVDHCLTQIMEYIEDVQSRKVPSNPQEGCLLMEAVSQVPKIDNTHFEAMLNSTMQVPAWLASLIILVLS